MQETQLHIHWDGTAPGLAEHRLSLDAFGPALTALLAAVRRIASGLVRDASDDPNYGRKGGRLAERARLLDLELTTIGEGSLELGAVCRMRVEPGANMPLLEDLPERATRRLLTAIEAEGRGRAENALVRRYLSRLPSGIHGQRYELRRNGAILHEVSLGTMKLPELPPAAPALLEVKGAIVGLGFEFDAPEVRISADERKYSCTATMEQVERAIELRQEPVRAMILRSGRALKLLWIRPMRESFTFADPRARKEYLLSHWEELLKRLAQ
ncbi:hypothetical protein [Anaeromyxobacter oryzae]|uniref:Uncharacterized protein n=1 Tax=Anaeromyxobacter oryzae TaxID=2918170 RepID=A0ABM7WR48_9BACT|nr:hypothetical protein [Anaeromyxobacter oryzae]BDG01948.1 hypothetical protein AMOR_09440 [Anaeromyxobacter oryzae]